MAVKGGLAENLMSLTGSENLMSPAGSDLMSTTGSDNSISDLNTTGTDFCVRGLFAGHEAFLTASYWRRVHRGGLAN